MNAASVLDVLECPVCMGRFNSSAKLPKVLGTCGHSICQECITRLLAVQPAQQGALTCPECRQNSVAPANGFPSNYRLLNMISSLGSRLDSPIMKCSACKENVHAVDAFLCASCVPQDDISGAPALCAACCIKAHNGHRLVELMKCPESIIRKSSEFNSAGGLAAIHAKLEALSGWSKRNEEILEEITRMLLEEKQNDESLRSQFGTKWSRALSDELTTFPRRDLEEYRQKLAKALDADAFQTRKFEGIRRELELLSGAELDLENVLPSQAADRQKVLKTLASAYVTYIELGVTLKQGKEFYEKLTEILVLRQQKCSDFCYARRIEAEDLVKVLRNTAPGMSVSEEA